jgi:Cu-processing system ATP-binding protein
VIAFDGVTKRYGALTVLQGLTASLPTGKITALVGPNGAGKTTLIKLLLGLTNADGGQVTINGLSSSDTPAARECVGWMPQAAHFPAHLSGRELLQLLSRFRPAHIEPELSLLEALDLGDAFDRPLGQLSGGTRQRVNAVLALAFRPTVLVLDEPTAGLDPLSSRVFKERLLVERARGTTVLITSHVLPELEEIADEVLFLLGGRAAWQGDIASLKQQTGMPTIERAVAHLLTRQPCREAA